MPPTPALALQHDSHQPLRPIHPATRALRQLRERIRQATADEVEARWKLLLQQLETLARLTARELAKEGATDPVVLQSEVGSLDGGLHEVSLGSVEIFACRLTSQELSRRGAASRRRGEGKAAALEAIARVRLDARALFEWARSDLWTGVARRAIVEANRTALDLERESPATVCRVSRTLARTDVSGGADELAQVAEDLALQELGRILALGHGLPVPARNSLQEMGLDSAHGVLARLAPRLRSRSAA